MTVEPSQIASIGRALAVLDLLAGEAREFGVTEISTRLGLSKPVVSRILAVLVEEGEVARNERSGQFSLTLKRPLSAIRFLESMGKQACWMPLLKDLATDGGEMVELYLFHAGALTCITSVDPPQRGLRVSSTLGTAIPLHATAAGKCWLAFAPRSIALPLVLERGLTGITARTLTSLDELLEELAVIRQRGFAIAEGEFDEGAAAAAAPVRLGLDEEWIVGSLAIVCPVARAPVHRLKELGLRVMLAAHQLGRQWPAILAGPYLLPVEGAPADSVARLVLAQSDGARVHPNSLE